ncbi:MAG: hypothetical protein ACYTHK_06720 [Planctomycetota bacterium]|jgi:hypothetical protein
MDDQSWVEPVVRNPSRDTEILCGLLRDEPRDALAARLGCSKRTVRRVRADNDEWLREQRQRLQEIAVEELGREMAEVMRSLVETAKNPESRIQPQAARVAGELAGVIGKGPLVHIGDNVLNATQVTLDPSVVDAYDPELHARLRAAMGLDYP